MATSLGASNIAFLDMAANQALMAQQVRKDLSDAFACYGIELDEFNVASVSLPEALQGALDERIAAGMKSGLGADKLQGFTRFQVASSIPLAAGNEGGVAGIGAGLGAGVAVGQAIAQGMSGAFAPPQAAAPASAPGQAGVEPVEARLATLKGLLDRGLISQADYDGAKGEILKKLIG